MQLPALTPKSLQFTAEIESDEALFKTLVKEPPQLIRFVARAAADELWMTAHTEFMEKALTWITQQFFQDRLLMSVVQKLVAVLRKHYATVSSFLPKNLTIKLEDRELPFSSLLLSSGSEPLRELVRRECRDRRKNVLNLPNVPYAIFEVIEEYLTTGNYLELVRKEKKEVVKILNWAMSWDLPELSEAVQERLIAYVDRKNVFKTLRRSHERHRLRLREGCFEFLNRLNYGYKMEGKGEEGLGFQFIDFNENSKEAFNEVKGDLTYLVARKKVAEDPQFLQTIKQCPKLKGLDLSESASFPDALEELPAIQDLDLSICDWVTTPMLEKMLALCPNLTHLTLRSDTKIDFEGWALLKKLPLLRNLDLTRCSQVGDNELSAILQATPELVVLNLEECRSISDNGFYELPNLNKNLINLNLSRTEISDQPLIELAAKCDLLVLLDVTRCEKLTSVGLVEAARQARLLREFNITLCDISKEGLASIRQSRPFLKVIIT